MLFRSIDPVLDRQVAAAAAEHPDVRMDGGAKPDEYVAGVKAEAEIEAREAGLLEVAAECFLRSL